MINFISISFSILLFILSGCSVNPVTGENQLMFISESQVQQLGKKYAPEVEKQMGGKLENPAIQNYINNVGQAIAAVSHRQDIQFNYAVVNDDSINAVALPGGDIFITRAMLEKLENEAQLASVLAHETAHITLRHSADAMNKQIGMDILLSAVMSESTPQGVMTWAQIGKQLLNLNYSRENEFQADRYGLDYLVKAGYDPYAMVEMMEMLERQNSERPFVYFSTHPAPADRKAALQERIATELYPANFKAGANDYKKFVLDKL